jgi:hypothetical protein
MGARFSLCSSQSSMSSEQRSFGNKNNSTWWFGELQIEITTFPNSFQSYRNFSTHQKFQNWLHVIPRVSLRRPRLCLYCLRVTEKALYSRTFSGFHNVTLALRFYYTSQHYSDHNGTRTRGLPLDRRTL